MNTIRIALLRAWDWLATENALPDMLIGVAGFSLLYATMQMVQGCGTTTTQKGHRVEKFAYPPEESGITIVEHCPGGQTVVVDAAGQ